MIARAEDENATKANQKRTENLLHNAYAYLCKFKHLTLPSLYHDTGVMADESGSFCLAAAPDTRQKDLPLKRTILIVSTGHLGIGIKHFARSCGVDETSERWKRFDARYKDFSVKLGDASERYLLVRCY